MEDEDKNLLAEMRITQKEIGGVQPLQQAKITLSSYDLSRYGNIIGKLNFVSDISSLPKNKESYYKDLRLPNDKRRKVMAKVSEIKHAYSSVKAQ